MTEQAPESSPAALFALHVTAEGVVTTNDEPPKENDS